MSTDEVFGTHSRVSISDLERHQLRLLRTELGLDPPPAADKRNTSHHNAAAA
jgi:hypothetical protein